MKLIDVLFESMADGNAFKAFVGAAIAKQETQANEGLNLSKKAYSIYAPDIGPIGQVNQSTLDAMIQANDVFEYEGQYYAYLPSKIKKKYNIK